MGGSWTNGNNTLDESSLWTLNNEIHSKSNHDITINDGNIELKTTDRSSEKSIQFNNSGATESLSSINFGTTGTNNYLGHISFSTKGSNDLYNDALTERLRINYNGNVGVGTTSPG